MNSLPPPLRCAMYSGHLTFCLAVLDKLKNITDIAFLQRAGAAKVSIDCHLAHAQSMIMLLLLKPAIL